MKNICIECGKKTKYMYGLNKGVFCQKHFQVALMQQKHNMEIQQLSQRMEVLFKPPLILPRCINP